MRLHQHGSPECSLRTFVARSFCGGTFGGGLDMAGIGSVADGSGTFLPYFP